MQTQLDRYRTLVEQRLAQYFRDDNLPQRRLYEAMRYSLLAGGKRIRPVLVMGFCEACGGRAEDALELACGVEMLHTYSLIHDDLPCMDDDALRRGRPTAHIVFGEWLALLAGDALQTAAFETVLASPLDAEKRAAAASVLARAAGALGMCAGQTLDMEGEDRTLSLQEIETINAGKTAAIIAASAQMGCIAAGGSTRQLDAAARYGAALGLAFQIQDDILDCESTTEVLGKPVGSDVSNKKSTYVSLLGLDRSKVLVRENTAAAKDAVRGLFPDTAFLESLADMLGARNA